MTNKLPVVGKKYRHKTLGNVVEFVGDREDGYFIAAEKTLKHYAGNYFLANYEELPDSNPQEVNGVDKALEAEKNMSKPEPKIFVDEGKVSGDYTAKARVSKNENDTLTIHQIILEEPKIDMKEERVEPVSIWKGLPEAINYLKKDARATFECFIKDKYTKEIAFTSCYLNTGTTDVLFSSGDLISDKKKQFCTITDFINSFEQMQKDIEELKRK